MSQLKPNDTGVEVFFIKYRKPIIVLCTLMLLYFPVHIYLDAPTISSEHKYQTIGSWLNDLIMYLAVPLGLLIYTRKVYKAHVKEVAEIDQTLKDNL